jgi:hypothetical protein
MSLAQVAARMGYTGEASGVSISRAGPSGRALEVTFTGDAGPHPVDGRRFAETLSLRSTLFQLRLEGGGEATLGAGGPGLRRSGLSRPRQAPVVLAAGDADVPLGRAPWGALGLLLLVAWGVAAYAYRTKTAAGRRA